MQSNLETLEFIFEDIPHEYKSNLKASKQEMLDKIISNFTFHYYNFTENSLNEIIKKTLCNLLKDNKFATYKISDARFDFLNNIIQKKNMTLNNNKSLNDSFVILCVEKKCYILKNIDNLIIDSLCVKETISFINTNSINDSSILEEISNLKNFLFKTQNNKKFDIFIIDPIIAYLIRRYYYPSYYFKDPSFFRFEDKYIFHDEIESFFNTNKIDYIDVKMSKLKLKINKATLSLNNNEYKTPQIHIFDENEFVKLRVIYNNSFTIIFLVIHIPTLFIFVLKETKNSTEREKNFCQNYSSLYFTKCYGIISNKWNISFIYEFMSGGSLREYIKNSKNNINPIFILNTIIRLYFGLSFLQSKSLIHRDLKPDNILVDHNKNIYISDFQTIKSISRIHQEQEEFTGDIGSLIYASHEQHENGEISFPTDIYSFGQIIYFLYTKRDCYASLNHLEMETKKISIPSASKNIQNLHQKCIKTNPNERPNLEEIEKIILEETNSNFYLKEYFVLKNAQKIDKIDLIQYFVENIAIRLKSKNKLKKYLEEIFIFFSIKYFFLSGIINQESINIEECFEKFKDYEYIINKNYSNILLIIGDIYYKNKVIEENLFKAKKFYELSAERGNSDALLRLGNLYYKGVGVKLDYSKFKQYYELAAQKGNSEAFLKFGHLYFNGDTVKQDYFIAKGYYEFASILNNSEAQLILGNYYKYGIDNIQNYSIAKIFFELSARNKNDISLLNLGLFYEFGIDGNKDYDIAKYYYKLSAKQNNSEALLRLGNLYENHLCTSKKYEKAKYYYELSAQQNNSEALIKLGNLYENNMFYKRDYAIAKNYYELAAKQNNSSALIKLGNLFENGLGVEINYEKAINYYESAKQNNFEAIIKLRNFYIEKENNIEKSLYYSKLLLSQNSFLDALFGVQFIYFILLHFYIYTVSCYSKYIIEKREDIMSYAYQFAKNFSKSLNNKHGNYMLGRMYLNGIGVKKDIEKAIKYLESASNEKNSEAILTLGYLYIEGIGVGKDYKKAKQLFKSAADLKNSYAFINLGEIYEYGLGVKQNYIKAKKYYELAAERNESVGYSKLGDFYFYGYGIEKNYQKAIENYEFAANKNDSNAFVQLGYIYFNGIGTQQDYHMAIKYFKFAAKQNNDIAFSYLGYAYFNGKGVRQDYIKAVKYFELAAKCNNISALVNLGFSYLYGKGIKQDYKKAKEYYESAAKYNNSEALFRLGYLYQYGYGVEQNYQKAKEYFKIAANNNHPKSNLHLGFLYENGFGVIKKKYKAEKYYIIAEKQNVIEAILKLGDLYYFGQGIEQNYNLAKMKYEKLLKYNSRYALMKLGDIYYLGQGVNNNYLKAIKYYILAAKQKDPTALYNLGYMYYNGQGVKPNYEKAKNYLILSSKQNNCKAQFFLGSILEKERSTTHNFDYLKYYKLAAKQKYSYALLKLGTIYLNGKEVDINLSKAIKYNQTLISLKNDSLFAKAIEMNGNLYVAYNNLGLIYITCFEDIEKAEIYLKEGAFQQYSFCQNNYGLLCQFYLNNSLKSKHFYERSSENNFPLAHYNLGYLYEKNGNISQSISYYIKASENIDEPLMFKDQIIVDTKYELSKKFIICLTNLKLAEYYLTLGYGKLNFAKIYFVKSISVLINENYIFEYNTKDNYQQTKKENSFSWIKDFIFNYPDFDFSDIQDTRKKLTDSVPRKREIFIDSEKKDIKLLNYNYYLDGDEYYDFIEETAINNPFDLFDFMMANQESKKKFVRGIHETIEEMKKILYKPPYSILFGRINIGKSNHKQIHRIKRTNINKEFYAGFEK